MTRRVLMTADAVGGVWTYALELARALASVDVDVRLAVMGPSPTPAQAREAHALSNLHLVCGAFTLEWMDEPWDDVARAGAWLLECDARWKPDIVHLNGYCHAALPWSAPVIVVGHSCVLSWWEAALGEPAPPRWARYREEVARGLAAADLVVAPTRAMRDTLCRHYGVRGGQVIPNGRTPERFQIGRKAPIVMTAGRLWDRAKNLDALAAVAPRLPWPVYAAGSTAESREPRTTATAHEAVDRNLHLLGPLSSDRLAHWLARASIFALPARYEPFGLSAVEAALAGCALVLGDIPSLRELWDGAALFVPPDDTDALHTALERLIAEPTARERIATAARARALEWSPERMAREYLSVYARC